MSKPYCGHIYKEENCAFCGTDPRISTSEQIDIWKADEDDTIEIDVPNEFRIDGHFDCVNRSAYEVLQEQFVWAKDALHRVRVIADSLAQHSVESWSDGLDMRAIIDDALRDIEEAK